MTRQDIDSLWQQALQTAIRKDELFTRYEFANLVLEAASEECERMMMYPGGRQESAAHDNVWKAAKAIRSMKT